MDSSTIVKSDDVCNEFDEAVDNSCTESYKILDQDVSFYNENVHDESFKN